MTTFFAGFLLGLSLIVAIGAQNAFVLRQGLLRSHVFAVCLFCAASDAVLILAGVAGSGVIVKQFPSFETAMRIFGAAFLLWYGWRSARAAWTGESALTAADTSTQKLSLVIATLAAFTWLNPHVYLDTVVLLGAISTQYDAPWVFGAGGATGSFVFFFSLGYGARLLAPVFRKPRAWQMLDAGIAIVMWLIAASLLAGL